MDNRFIGSWELEGVDEPEQLVAFAKAYLSASKVLCQKINENIVQAKYADGCVVIFTAYHAVELFLKGMIIKKNPDAKLHHDVEKLAIDYHRLYPEENHYWRVPFGVVVLGDNSEAEKKFQDLKKELPVEQIYRYPINKNGKTWLGAYAFEPKSFMKTVILPLEDDFRRLENLIFA
jgi:HEPN domain